MGIDQSCLEALYDPLTYDHGPPFKLLHELREQRSIVWVEEHELPCWPGGEGFWLVLRHAEVGQVLKDASTFSSHLGGTQLRNPATGSDLAFVRKMMLNMDPPEHTRLRRLLVNAFTSRAVDRLRSRIRANAEMIITEALGSQDEGECDFARVMAADLPLLTLADILGMPAEDRFLMYDWANRAIGYQDPDYRVSSAFDPAQGSAIAREALALRPQPDEHGQMPDPRTRAGMPDLYHYAHLLGEQKRQAPEDDIMSVLMSQVDADGGKVSLEEFENLFWLFAVAGNETVRNGIPGGLIGLMQHPEQLDRLRRQRELMPLAVDEMLRWWSPVMVFRRTATTDTTLGGQSIRRGDKVLVSFTSSNRDDRVFENPDVLDITRDPNPHFALGYGPHFCLGAQLGKAEMAELFTALLDRVVSIEPAGAPTFLRSNFQRGVKTLPVRWRR